MKPEEFVDVIRAEVRDAAASDVIRQLQQPSGRRPAEELRLLSEWFNSLTDADKKAVAGVARMASHHAVFGMLCVLDGVRAIEDGADKGSLQLTYTKNGQTELLSPSDSDLLHDMLNAQN
jgi:hypothetical protein